MRITSQSVYVDSNGIVLATSGEHKDKVTPTVEAMQARMPEIVEKITGAPLRLLVKTDSSEKYSQKTSGDGTDISHYSIVTNLSVLKTRLKSLVGDEIEKRIYNGFQHTGTSALGNGTVTLTFSLYDHSQRNYLAALISPESIAPVDWPDKDDMDALSLASATDVSNFANAALAAVRQHRADGAMARISIEGAADEATAQAIFDSYIG